VTKERDGDDPDKILCPGKAPRDRNLKSGMKTLNKG